MDNKETVFLSGPRTTKLSIPVRSVPKKMNAWKKIQRHSRRLSILVVSALINNALFFGLIGLLNRKFHFLKSVFVAYGASREYTLSYFYSWHARTMLWSPWPVGIYRQNGKWGLMVGITTVESDFLVAENTEGLALLVENTEKFRRVLGAEQTTYAGILPGILSKTGLRRESPETDVTVAAVNRALSVLCETIGYSKDVPIIVLGGHGHVGRLLVKLLRLWRREVYPVDLLDGKRVNHRDWPTHLVRKQAVLVNLVPMLIIENYAYSFWPEMVILNEAYPPPDKEDLEHLRGAGVRTFHLVGVEALSIPSFPLAYQGGIPCCAAWNAEDLKVILREITSK